MMKLKLKLVTVELKNYVNVIPANRRTAEAQALPPYLQVDLMLLLPITGKINFHPNIFILIFAFLRMHS